MKKFKHLSKLVLIAALVSGCGQSSVETTGENTTTAAEQNTNQEEITSKAEEETKEEAETEVKEETETKAGEEEKQEAEVKEESSSSSNKGGALPKPAVSAKDLVATAYAADDEYIAFREEFTQNFLDKTNEIYSHLDERYIPPYDDDVEFYKKEDSSFFGYSREVISDDMAGTYKYIMEVDVDMGFCDASDELYAWQSFDLSLCDEDKDGKVEINDETFGMIQTFYEGITLDKAKIQEKIDEAVKEAAEESYNSIRLEMEDKYYGSLDFSWLTYEDYPLEIQISGDWYQDYPVK